MTDMHNEGIPDEQFDNPDIRSQPKDATTDAGGDVDMHNEWWSGLLSLVRRLLRLGR